MLNANAIGSATKVGADVSASALVIPVQVGTGHKLDPGVGNHLWITMRRGNAVERMKVIARNGDLLTVEGRGADGTSAQALVAGDCLLVEWNPAMLCEFVKNCTNGAPEPSGVTPGVYCMDKCTCFTVGAGGLITAVSVGAAC
jgi:hypothetical protein